MATYRKIFVTQNGGYEIWLTDTELPLSPYNPAKVPNDYQDYVDRIAAGEVFPETPFRKPEPSSILPSDDHPTTYEKRFISESGDFEVWEILPDETKRKVWSERPDFLARVAAGEIFTEIPYVAPPPIIVPEPIPVSFFVLKDVKIGEIADAYDMELSQGCLITFLGREPFRIDCEPQNCADFTGKATLTTMAKTSGIPVPPIEIGTFDNKTIMLTYEEFVSMCFQLGGYVQNLRSKKWYLRMQLDAITEDTPANRTAISAITWEA